MEDDREVRARLEKRYVICRIQYCNIKITRLVSKI